MSGSRITPLSVVQLAVGAIATPLNAAPTGAATKPLLRGRILSLHPSGFYNPKHTQRRVGYRSPMDFEKKLFHNPVPTCQVTSYR